VIEQYQKFLKAKCRLAEDLGHGVSAADVNPTLKPHQKDSVLWMVQGGRRALFASFGLGKTFMQLEAVRLTLAAAGGRGLITNVAVMKERVQEADVLLARVYAKERRNPNAQ